MSATMWTKCVTTKNYLLPRLVETFANNFLFISTQPHMGHSTHTRYIYLSSASAVGSGGVNYISPFEILTRIKNVWVM